MTLQQYIKEFLQERAEFIAKAKAGGYYYPELDTAGEYTSASGKKCYRTVGGLNYYFLKCSQLGITPKCITSLSYEAHGNGFSLDWVEHDIILALEG